MRKPDAAINQVSSNGFGYGQSCDESFGDFLLGQFRSSAVNLLQSLSFTDGLDDLLLIAAIVVHSCGLRLSSLAQFRLESAYVLDRFVITGDGLFELFAELMRGAGQFPLR